MGKILTVITLALILAALGACNTSGCMENQSAMPVGGFYSSDDKAITIDSIQVWGVGSPGDSMLVDGNAREVSLPLRATLPEVSFCIHYTQEALSSPLLNDTLTIAYTSTPHFVSEECGAMYFYSITGVSHTIHLIDSVRLEYPEVDNLDRETLRIYFRTETEDPDEPTDPES